MPDFLKRLRSGEVLVMDGAMGTELQRAGVSADECYELLNLTDPERVMEVHRAYASAGAEIFVTNTFQANPAHLARYGCADRLEEIFQAAVANAGSATGGIAVVLASIGPTQELSQETRRRLAKAPQGAHAVLLETWSDPEAASKLARAISLAIDIPVLMSFSYCRTADQDVSTFANVSPEVCAAHAKTAGAVALGVNCGRDLTGDDFVEIVGRYRSASRLPIFARPNAGTPIRQGEQWLYPKTPETMAGEIRQLLEQGVCMVGGCCGTTPEHIAALRKLLHN